MSLVIVPVTGPTELLLYKANPGTQLARRGVAHLVNVALTKDGVKMGAVMFSLDEDLPRNTRATRWTGLLTGSYVAVNGLAAFDVDEDTGLALMFDRLKERENHERQDPGPDSPRTLRKAREESGF